LSNDTLLTESTELQTGFMVDQLARLPEKAIVDERHLASVIQKHPRTIQRMIDRGELPPPIDFANHKVWLVTHILTHLEKALDRAAIEAEREVARIAKFSP